MIKTAIFDLDGTLVDTLGDMHVTLNRALHDMGLPRVERHELLGFIGGGVDDLLVLATKGVTCDLVRLKQRYGEYYRDHAHLTSSLFPGVESGLTTLRQAGITLGVLTNKPERSAHHLLHTIGAMHWFVKVAGPDTYGCHKPNPDGLLALMQEMGASPATTVMVGDADTDILAGRGANVATIAVTYGYRSSDELGVYQPTVMATTFSEAVGVIMNPTFG